MPSSPGGGISGFLQRLLDPESPVSLYHAACEKLYGLAPPGFGWIYQGPTQTTCDLAKERPRTGGAFFEDVLAQAPAFLGVGVAVATGGTGAVPLALTSARTILQPEPPTELYSRSKVVGPTTEVKMPAQDDWGFGDLFSGFGDFFADTTFQDVAPLIAPTISYFGGGGTPSAAVQRVSSSLPASFVPYSFDPSVAYGNGGATPTGAMVPAIRGAMTIWSAGRQAFALLRQRLPGLTLSTLKNMVRTMGPVAAAAALGIGLDQLMLATSVKGRRMNPANVKALRRGMRRIKSFHRLCAHADLLRSRGRSRARAVFCPTCKKSPCRC